MSEKELMNDNFEMHVAMEGTIEDTGMTFQARSSYLPSEVMWGNRFEPMVSFDSDVNKYQVV
jgi:hypothetical protein